MLPHKSDIIRDMNIPAIFRSSVDPTQVSLTVVSIGKAGASLIVFLGMIGIVDPSIAGAAWGNFVASIVTAIPAGFAVYHTAQAVWGLFRKAAVKVYGAPAPTTTTTVTVAPTTVI